MFSLVVCTVDRFDQLERLFSSLTRQEERRFEVILVDQNEDDRLGPLVDGFAGRLAIRRIRSPRGLSRARNRGIDAAAGDIVCFPDDDCWYRSGTLKTAAALLAADARLAIVTGRTLDADGAPSVSPTGEQPVTITRRNYLSCGNSNGIFVRRQALAAIGGFDEALGVGAASPFQSGEEADLLLRAIAAGKTLGYFPELIVHHDQVTAEIGPRQIERARKYGRGFGALLRKHRFPFAYVLWRLARPLAGWTIAALRRDRAAADYKRAWLAGIAEGYRSWPRWDGA
ncbi:glycosyltransferase [Rhizobium sp. P32RR-XVIII]|uniref:glycosyltransferase family 2 protein n=1 Tax=Rhizobium sp. P32RR-XVIII TaxID=2726738 RepID=UPI00145789A7|nr:glycosyltransferase family 2 protein [Rhizobium sp. P32RR-XVIII]NLS05743.1 glycosyltransferase [Rhizobium sp. P32RR-XVIII]